MELPPIRTNPLSLQTICDHLESSIKSFLKSAVQWDHDEQYHYKRPAATLIPYEEVQPILAHIRTIRENSLWVNYPQRLQTNVVVSLQGCIDSVDREDANLAASRSVALSAQLARGIVRRSTKALQDLKRDVERSFTILSDAEEHQPEILQRGHEYDPSTNNSPQGQAASAANPASGILQKLVNEIKALKTEVDHLRATPPGRRPVGDQPSRVVLEHFMHAPEAFLNSLANPPFSHTRQHLRSNVPTASLLSDGVSQIVAPPYELSESGRRQYSEWSGDVQRAYRRRGDERVAMEQEEGSTGSSGGSNSALTLRSTFSIPLRPSSYRSLNVENGGYGDEGYVHPTNVQSTSSI